jgi:hypothetical protein
MHPRAWTALTRPPGGSPTTLERILEEIVHPRMECLAVLKQLAHLDEPRLFVRCQEARHRDLFALRGRLSELQGGRVYLHLGARRDEPLLR